ncbi:hypothetical protein TRFO_28284 [Tritrichomonas foetus]|uniref:DNA topoisomerase n=1 Tax=Tritrichomonas foetus TaxID=1144522 RepID=A0A1J4JYK8_9EUKA|nr:hypothetical protein TRFO_28284 [Tritrichomonas foetus]|eukprot:OHT04241.1 hypothetical protein TRFO_28284 [Tritrichomonas foetus]
MADILGVAQNPKIAETIAKALSNSNFDLKTKISKTNPVYSFSYNFQGSPQQFKLFSLNGRVFSGTLVTNPENLLLSLTEPIQYNIAQNDLLLLSNIKEWSERAETIIAFANETAEGDYFAYELSKICQKTVLRPIFHSLSPADLEESMTYVSEFREPFSQAYSLKNEFLIRFSDIFGNFFKQYFVKHLKNKANNAYIGPIEMSILSHIYNACYDRDSFVPEESSKIELVAVKDNIEISPKWVRKNIFCPLTSFSLYATVVNKDITTCVSDIFSKQTPKPKPRPMNSSKLLCLAMKYLKLSSSDTFKFAIELYEAGFISYPFTNTTNYPEDFDFHSIVSLIAAHPALSFAVGLRSKIEIPERKIERKDTNLENNDEILDRIEYFEMNSYLPIYPTNVYPSNDSSPKTKLYLLIARHFLASLSNDGEINETTVLFEVADEQFELTYKRLDEFSCWVATFPYISKPNDPMPEFSSGEILNTKSIKLVQNKSQAPEYLTERKLYKIMNKIGIGGKETFDALNKLISSNLIKKTFKNLKTTDFSSALVVSFEETGFDFRDTYFTDLIAKAVGQTLTGEGSSAKVEILTKLHGMTQEIISKGQNYKGVLDLVLKGLSM